MSNHPIRKPRTLIENLLEFPRELFELSEAEERMLFGGLVVNQTPGKPCSCTFDDDTDYC